MQAVSSTVSDATRARRFAALIATVSRPVAALCAALLLAGASQVRAQTPEEFYKGRQLTLIVFSGAGSTYDIYARLLVRHFGRHIPGNPTFIVQNLPGGGGLKAIDYLNTIAPKDGSVMGTIGRAACRSSRCSARTRSGSIRCASPGSAA